MAAIRAVFADWRPDIVNTHSSIDHWLSAVARMGLRPRPVIVRTRHISAPVSRNLPTRWLYNQGCERVMTTSEAMVGDLTRDGFLKPGHVVAIPTGIDTGRFFPGDRGQARKQLGLPQDAFIFGNVATLRSWKGHAYALDALAMLGGGKAMLLLVGDGPQEENLAAQIARLGLGDRVHMVGRQDDVVPYLRAMDAFVFPSTKNEGVPQALLQAMACGLPFVASQVGGVPEVADGLGGVVLVALEDVAALSSAMAKMMAAPCEGAALHGLRDRVTTRYGIADMAERVESVFDSALAGAEKP